MNMPKRMQVLKMQDELRRQGISSDLVDLEAHVDSRLSYPENYQNIMKRYKRVGKKVSTSAKSTSAFMPSNVLLGFEMQQARAFHQSRTQQARQADEAVRAKRTITEKQIVKNSDVLRGWYRRPGALDIMGIDALGHSKTRQTKLKRKYKKKK